MLLHRARVAAWTLFTSAPALVAFDALVAGPFSSSDPGDDEVLLVLRTTLRAPKRAELVAWSPSLAGSLPAAEVASPAAAAAAGDGGSSPAPRRRRLREACVGRVHGLAGDVYFDSPLDGFTSVRQLAPGQAWVERDGPGGGGGGDEGPRGRCSDSLELGPLPSVLLEGVVVAVAWPPSRARWLE